MQSCLEVLHKLSKDWIVVFPPELDSVVHEAQHVSSGFKRGCEFQTGTIYSLSSVMH